MITPLTFDRVRTALGEFGVLLFPGPVPESATANLNGFRVTLVLLDTVFIVRADAVTEIPANTDSPLLYLAANEVNCAGNTAKATIVNRGETLIVRTERDLPIAAGISEAQLRDWLRAAIDEVLAGQDALARVAERLSEAPSA